MKPPCWPEDAVIFVRIVLVRAVLFCVVSFKARDRERRPGAEFAFSLYGRRKTGARIKQPRLRLSAYSLGQMQLELASSLCCSESGQEARSARFKR